MKVLFCKKCGDIRAFSNIEFTYCKCNNVGAKWDNPVTGTVLVRAKEREYVRIIGLNNSFLMADKPDTLVTGRDEWWRDRHNLATVAPGYLFDRHFRNCWACIIKVGESNDVKWDDNEIVKPKWPKGDENSQYDS